MADEDGFQVAAAWVSVTPDVSNFEQALDEELGGLTIAVRVLPDVSDLQGAVDQEHLTADVRLVADPSDLQGQVDDETGGLTASIAVGADTAPAQAELHTILDEIDAARGDLFVSADTGAARKQAESLAEDFGGLSSDLTIGADTGNASAGVERLTGDLDGLTGAAGHASAGLSAAEGSIAAIESHAGSAALAVTGLAGALAGAHGGMTGITVVPEFGQFNAMLDDATGGSDARVTVVPDLEDFAQQVDEETGGVVVSARLVPDTADFQDQVDERLGDLTATVSLLADGGQAEAQVRDFASSAVPELGGIADAAGDTGRAIEASAEMFQTYLSGRAASQAALDALNGVTGSAAEATASIESDFEDLEAEAGRLSQALRDVDDQFLSMANAQFGPATDLELSDLTARFENLYGQIGDVQGQLASLRGEFDSAGGDFAGLDQGFGNVAGALRTFDENLAGTEEALGTVAGDFFDMQEQASRMGVSLDELPAKIDAAFAGYVERADAAKASLIALNEEQATVAGGAGGAAEDAGETAGGILGSIGERLSYMAVDPFMWMMAVPAMIGPIDEGIHALDAAMNPVSQHAADLGQQMTAAAAHVDYAASSWEHLASSERAYASDSGSSIISQAIGEAAQHASEQAVALTGHLSVLSDRYGITAAQAGDLAQAAGVTAKQLTGGGDAAKAAMGKIEAYADANIGARGPVTELSGDMATFGNDTLTASSRIGALDDAYGLLTGNFASTQQAVLGVAQDFLTVSSNAKQAGASMTGTNSASVTLQQSFFAMPDAIEATANAMVKQGDSAQQVNTYITDQIGKLSGLTGGSATAQQAVTDLKTWEDNLAASTKATTQAQDDAATQMATQFTAQVRDAGDKSSTTTGLVNGLKTAILNTGTTSQQTANLRAELITSLENAGIKAKTAAGDVDGFISKIAGIPKSTNWTLTEHAAGTWTEQQTQAMVTLPGTSNPGLGVVAPGHAGGGMVLGGSGKPAADDIPARLSSGEYVVQADAVGKYGVGMLDSINAKHFAAGGLASLAGSYSGSATGLGGWNASQYGASENDLANVLVGSANAAGKAAASAASTGAGPVGGAAGSVQALAQKMAAARGWTGAQWAALNAVETAEAGWNLGATNPSSGAYGIAQFINGPSEYAQYGGNSGTASGQITAMLAYIAQRYGNPEAAEAHEAQYHWYKNGGRLNPGQSAVVGDGGLPEVVTAGMSGATVTPVGRGAPQVTINFTGMQYPSAEQIANLKSELAYALVGAP